jgi:hypothetical protein
MQCDMVELGESLYLKGITSGVPDEAWDLFRETNCC